MAAASREQSDYADTTEKIIVAVEDEWNIWPLVKPTFEARLPLRKAVLHNKAKKPVEIERLPIEYITSTDPRLRSRPPAKNSPHWFRHPYCTLILVPCEDADDYRQNVRPKLQVLVKNEWREFLLVHIPRTPQTEASAKLAAKVYARMCDHFRKDRCCKLDIFTPDPGGWAEMETRVVEAVRNTLDIRVTHYDAEVRRLSEHRHAPDWNFCSFFVDKESLAFMLEMAQLRDDALREYDELEVTYLELVRTPYTKLKQYGGEDRDDARAAVLEPARKPFSSYAQQDSLKQFDFRQYLFARQAILLFAMGRSIEVADRGLRFVREFSREIRKRETSLPFCLKEVWVFTACVTLARACGDHFSARYGPLVDRDFYRTMGDLYSYARTKLMRLGDLIGYGKAIVRTPCNSAALSMSPWPRPAVWPALPPNAAAKVKAKELLLQEDMAAFSKLTAPWRELQLAPRHLLHAANKRRAAQEAAPSGDLWAAPEKLSHGERRYPSPPARTASGRVTIDDVEAELASGGKPSPPAAPRAPAEPPANKQAPPRSASRHPVHSREAPTLTNAASKALSLPEIQASAELALEQTVSHRGLRSALASIQSFEEAYLELTKLAAECYHKAGRRRQGLALEGELAAVHLARGAHETAGRLLEKLCALYGGERWHHLLVEVLPKLSACQLALGDLPGHLGTCVKLLSLEGQLAPPQERRRIQRELVGLARSGLQDTISLETSAILTFAASATPPLELCEGDPGGLQVTIWSGLPEELALDALTLTLVAPPSFSADEGIKVKAAEGGAVLQPGKNLVPMRLTAQGKGAYVPAVLTAVLGKARLRSSAASISGGPPDADDHLSVERPFRPVVRVAPARQLVEISPAVAWGLLVGHTQWLGLLIQPLSYSLKGALLRIIPGPGLTIQQPQLAEMELFVPPGGSSEEQQAGGGSGVAAPESPAHRPAARQVAPSDGAAAAPHVQFSADTRAGRGEVPPGGGAEGAAAREGSGGTEEQDDATCAKREGPEGSPVGRQRVELRDGELALPDWAADKPTVLWLQVAARRDRQDISLSPQATSPQAMTPASVPVLHSPGAVPLTPFMPAGAQQRGFPPHTPPSAGGSSLGGSGEREGNDPASSASSQVSVSPMENAPSGRPSWFTAPRSAVEGQRVVDVKLEFGPNRARLYDRQLGVQFTEPFQALTRVVSRSRDGKLLLQVTLRSQVPAELHIQDAQLSLQDGFLHTADNVAPAGGCQIGGPDCAWLLPLSISPESEGALLFNIQVDTSSRAREEEAAAAATGGAPADDQLLDGEDEAPPGSSSRRQLSKQPPTLDVSSLRRRHLNSVLRVKYRLGGDRTVGAHPPPSQDQDQDRHLGGSGEVSSDDRSSSAARGSGDGAAVDSSRKGIKRGGSATGVGGKGKDEEHEEDGGEGLQEGEEGRGEEGEKESERGGQQLCTFVHTFAMQAPMMERHLAVGMLAMPARPPRVGEAVLLQWRVERLIPGCASAGTAAPPSRTQPEELDFEVKLNPDHWMAAGRKKGFLLLPQEEGARAHVSIACLPLVAGHVHPPALRLPHVNKGHVSHNPPAPHLICVYPPAQCMSFCVSKLV